MTSSTPARRRSRLAGIAVVASAVAAGSLTPVLVGSATAATLLPGPSVVGPRDAAPVLKEVVLDWAEVVGAKGYVVQVGTDDEWSDDPTLEVKTVATRATLPVTLPHASYVWRVAAVGAQGQGRWSSAGTFTRGWTEAPTPLAPSGTVPGEVGYPTFRWTAVPNASEYQVQVSTSPYFDAPFRNQAGVLTQSCFTTRTTVTPMTGQKSARNDGAGDCIFKLIASDEPRYWRVRPLDHAVDDAPEVNTTPVVDEGVSSQPPAKPEELDTSACPAPPGTKPSTSPTPAPTAAPSASASPGAAPSDGPSASASPSAKSDDDRDECKPAHVVEKGPWSASVAFQRAFGAPTAVPWFRDLAAPDRPTLSTDVCTGTQCRDFPSISWNRVPGAQAYRLYVALDAAYGNIHEVVETTATTWTPNAQWRDSTAGASYHVLVQPCTWTTSDDGRAPGCGEPSAPAVFRKSSPKLAPLLPADGAQLGGGEVVLSWQSAAQSLSAATGGPATSEAYAYRVQVTTPDNPDFQPEGLVDDTVVDSTHHVSAKKSYGDGPHLWRVQPVDASGHRLPWSAVRTFTRDATPPAFSVRPGSGLAVDGALTVAFSEPVTGVGSASVSLAGVPSTVTLSADARTAVVRPLAVLAAGATHVLTVTDAVRDLAGNRAAGKAVTVKVAATVDDRSKGMSLGGGWQRLVASNAVAGTYSRSVPSAGRPTVATVAVSGRGVEVKGCVGPSNGVVELWADGGKVARVDTYRSYSGCGVVLTRSPFPTGAGVHRVEVRGTGAKNRLSKGTAVSVDALTAIR